MTKQNNLAMSSLKFFIFIALINYETFYRIPIGFSIKLLSDKHAEKIDSVWPNRHHGSLEFIKRIIAWNPNVGLFKNDDNELVAWSLR